MSCLRAIARASWNGWGQTGPLAQAAGHDINYLSLTGALHAIGLPDKPVVPLNLGADYGGGAMFLLVGILAAVLNARATGNGQVVDAAMTDGASYLMTAFYGRLAEGSWVDRRGANFLDGGAHFYDTFQCSDGLWISLGPIEPQFYDLLLDLLGRPSEISAAQMDRSTWAGMHRSMEKISRAEAGPNGARYSKEPTSASLRLSACPTLRCIRTMPRAEPLSRGTASFSPLPHRASRRPLLQCNGRPRRSNAIRRPSWRVGELFHERSAAYGSGREIGTDSAK